MRCLVTKRGGRGLRGLPGIHRGTLCLSVQCDWLTKSSNASAFSLLSSHVVFITTITLALSNDDSSK